MSDHDLAAARLRADRAEEELDRARSQVEHLRQCLMRSDEKLTEFSLEVSTIRSQLISSGYLQSSTGDVGDALTRALADAEPVRTARQRGDELPRLNTRPTPDLHRVTPLLGEPGLSIRSDRFTLVSEADGRTALAQIERSSLSEPHLWKVSVPAGVGVTGVCRIVEGWSAAVTAAVELAALVRQYRDVAEQTHQTALRVHDWSSGTLAETPSTR